MPKINVVGLNPCADAVAEARMEEKLGEDSIGPTVALGSCHIIRNIYLVSSSGSWHTAPKTL